MARIERIGRSVGKCRAGAVRKHCCLVLMTSHDDEKQAHKSTSSLPPRTILSLTYAREQMCEESLKATDTVHTCTGLALVQHYSHRGTCTSSWHTKICFTRVLCHCICAGEMPFVLLVLERSRRHRAFGATRQLNDANATKASRRKANSREKR